MFKLPAYDPLVIAWVGFGILAITALGFCLLARCIDAGRLRAWDHASSDGGVWHRASANTNETASTNANQSSRS